MYKNIQETFAKPAKGIPLEMFTPRRNSAAVTSCTNKHKTLRTKNT